MSRTLFSLAGFQVILIGRFWVIAEGDGLAHSGKELSYRNSKIASQGECRAEQGQAMPLFYLGYRSSSSLCFTDDEDGELRRARANLCEHFQIGAGTTIAKALSDLGHRKPDLFLLDMY